VDVTYQFDPHQPIKIERPKNAAEAAQVLQAGNNRFVDFIFKMRAATLGEEVHERIAIPVDLVSLGLPLLREQPLDQRPFAMVLSCSDARAPIERIFDQGFNNLFVIRIAGNVLGTECLGSVDYAVRHLADSLKVIVVLGHSGCGAVTAAVDAYLEPVRYAQIAFTHALRSLVDRIMIAVRVAAAGFEQCGARPAENRSALIEAAAYVNAAMTAHDLTRETEALGRNDLHVMYGVCDLGTMLVRAQPAEPRDAGSSMRSHLAECPLNAADFAHLARAFAQRLLDVPN
jgi:carbonic anhydrase